TADILHDVKASIVKYGRNADNDAVIKNIDFNENGHGIFELEFKGENLGAFELSVPGLHNIYNATAAILTAYVSSIDLELIRDNIKSYSGVGRRFEVKGNYNDALVVDDYAHHPTELKATLSAAKKMKKAN
ncbi:glutamate ligase domain-containing protein, partial [Clostridium tertium]